MPTWLALICIFASILALIQALLWLNNTYFAPRWQRKLPERKPFSELVRLGFSVPATSYHHETDVPATVVGLVGELEGYAVEIASNYTNGWFKAPYFIIRVFFNTDNLTTSELLARRENNLSQSKHIRWSTSIELSTNYLEDSLTISRNAPYRIRLILGMAEDLIAEIKKLGLNPVSYAEGINQSKTNQA